MEKPNKNIVSNQKQINTLLRTEIKQKQTIKGIIFDVGGVLIHYPAEKYYEYLSKKHDISADKIQGAFDPVRRELELGNITIYNLFEKLSQELKIAPNQFDWQKSFMTLSKTDKKMMRLINDLSKNYKIYLLTNITKTGFSIYNKEFERNNCKFDKKFASCYLHMRKPDPKIYLHVLKKTKLMPYEAVFVDDKQKNIDAALSIGINGIVFNNINQLINNLKKLNIKINYSYKK